MKTLFKGARIVRILLHEQGPASLCDRVSKAATKRDHWPPVCDRHAADTGQAIAADQLIDQSHAAGGIGTQGADGGRNVVQDGLEVEGA